MKAYLDRVVEYLQIDRSLAYVIASRAWQGVSGPITILFVVAFLSQDQQGIYYGILSVVAIQAFFELGFLNVLVGHSSHAAAISDGSVDSLEFDSSMRRVGELVKASTRWFLVVSVLFAIIAFLFGWHTFNETEVTSPVSWQWPFIVVVPCAAISLYYAPRMAILEGAGFRETVYRYRCYQAITGSFAVWCSLALGFHLWCLVVATSVQTLWSWYVVRVRHGNYFRKFLLVKERPDDYSWSQDVVPAQWRMAVLSVTQHLATQCFTIIVLLFHHDAVEAGRLGMTLSVTGAIQMLALAWLQTKFPVVAAIHGQGDREKAGSMWRHTTFVSTMLLILAFTVLIVLVILLPSVSSRFEGRLIMPWQIAVIGIGCLAYHLLASQSFYVLARRIEPLMIMAAGMIAASFVVWLAGYMYSTNGIVWAYAGSIGLIVLPLHTWAYSRLRKDS